MRARIFPGVMTRFRLDRRGATAIIIALMSVPMIIAAGAAIDFSRIASARAQLQAAADTAAVAGVGAFQTNQDGTIAGNVTQTAFNASSATLSAYAGISSTIGTRCNAANIANVTCGTGTTAAANANNTHCPATTVYCVQINTTATLKNSLLGFLIPNDVLNVTATAQTLGGASVSASNFNHPVIYGGGQGSASPSDSASMYAYSVPTDGSGNPQYSNIPTPNTDCANSSYGTLQYEATAPAANGVSACNYVLIGTNTSASNSGGLNFQQTDPLAFTFIDFTGGNITSGTADLDDTSYPALGLTGIVTLNSGAAATQYTSEIYVTTGGSTSYYASGLTKGAILGVGGTALYGTCPAHNLYGSITAYPNNSSANIVPYQDSIDNFNSTWEFVGYPPTHSTNHALLPFLGPSNTQTISGTTYVVQAICPQWPVTGTSILATASFSPSNLPSGYAPVVNASGNYPTATNVRVYATYYPDVAYTSGTGVYPPPIAGCSPAGSLTDGGVTPVTDLAWWGWSPANLAADPGGAAENPGGIAEGDCTFAALNSVGVLVTGLLNSLQTPAYDNCALLIQPLGTTVPTTNGIPNLPDYYTYNVELLSFLLPTVGNLLNINLGVVTGNASGIIGMTPVYDGQNGDTHAAGYVPASVSITGSLLGPYTITEPPAYGHDNYPPEDTSHQCYNPQAGSTAGPGDPVENPQYGALFCATNPPQNYALYWNDMGSWAKPALYNDDLGYDNAITEFTCPTPANPGASGPPTLIY